MVFSKFNICFIASQKNLPVMLVIRSTLSHLPTILWGALESTMCLPGGEFTPLCFCICWFASTERHRDINTRSTKGAKGWKTSLSGASWNFMSWFRSLSFLEQEETGVKQQLGVHIWGKQRSFSVFVCSVYLSVLFWTLTLNSGILDLTTFFVLLALHIILAVLWFLWEETWVPQYIWAVGKRVYMSKGPALIWYIEGRTWLPS